MASVERETLSQEELRKRLYQTFKSRGVLDTLKVCFAASDLLYCPTESPESHAEYKCLTLSTKYHFCHNLISIRGDVCGVCCVWVFPPCVGCSP